MNAIRKQAEFGFGTALWHRGGEKYTADKIRILYGQRFRGGEVPCMTGRQVQVTQETTIF